MQRPKREENEEDLLRFQDEFLKQQATPSAKLHRVTRNIPSNAQDNGKHNHRTNSSSLSKSTPSCHLIPVFPEVKEHTDMEYDVIKQKEFSGGFPNVPQITDYAFLQSKSSSGKKKSLFAQQFLAQKASAFGLKNESSSSSYETPYRLKAVAKELCSADKNDTIEDKGYRDLDQSSLVTGKGLSTGWLGEQELMEIHDENLEKLSKMSHEEILDVKEKLESSLDPSLLKFIKTKKNTQKDPENFDVKSEHIFDRQADNSAGNSMPHHMKKSESASFNPYIAFNINKDLPGMDVLEHEKLEWMKDMAKPSCKENKVSNTVRFDFEGHLISRDVTIPVNRGLHHHGDDSSAPGYTLEELFKLARSSFMQQRVFALKLLAKILEQYQRGSFHDEIQNCLLELLIDAGLPFLLRWSLDDSTNAIYCASIYAIYALLWNPVDNDALDELLYQSDRFRVHSLIPPNSEKDIKILKSERKGKLMDTEMISIDLIKGLIQIQLLPRLRYILEICQPDDITINYCMDILSRVALHSPESAYKIMECPRMIRTVINMLLPITWSLDNAFPCYKALRLIRLLCIGGKGLCSTLWKDHDLCTRVLRYASLVNGDNDTKQEGINLAVESIHIWRICIMQGVAISATIDAHSFLISLLQRYAVVRRGLCIDIMSSVVLLSEAVVRTALHCTQQKVIDSHQRGCNENELQNTIRIEWNLVSGLHAILLHSLSEEIKHFISQKKETPNLRGLATLLSFLSTFIETASVQPSVNKLTLLSDIGTWTENIVLKILECHNFGMLVDQISRFSDFMTPQHLLNNYQAPSCFPNHGMGIFKEHSRILNENSTFVFLMSFVKLLHNIVIVNKQCIDTALPLLKSKALVGYCKSISPILSSTRKISFTAMSSVIERQFLYHLLSLVEKAILLSRPGILEPSCCRIYHATAFELLTLLQSAEEMEARDIMVNFIFNRKFYELTMTGSDVTTRLHELVSPHSWAFAAIEKLLHAGMENLGPIFDVYRKYCFHDHRRHRDSFLTAKDPGLCIPCDWIFLPVVSLYNSAVNIELSGDIISKVTADAITPIEMNLSFLLILEVNKPETLKHISESMRFVRLLCIFLLGSDVFLEPRIHVLLTSLITIYATEKALGSIEFSSSVPGISSFYDLFCEILIQFSACSFGDHTFSNYLLIPLQKKHDVKYRKAIWGEHCNALKCFSMPIKSVILNLSYFLDDAEQDEELLQLYLRNIISETVTQDRCPFFYLVAVHHLSRFIFDEEQIKAYSEIKVSKASLRILNQVLFMTHENSKSDIILYESVDPTLSKGFKTFNSLPAYRQLIIENRSKGMS